MRATAILLPLELHVGHIGPLEQAFGMRPLQKLQHILCAGIDCEQAIDRLLYSTKPSPPSMTSELCGVDGRVVVMCLS